MAARARLRLYVNVRSLCGLAPLHYAVYHERHDALHELLRHDPDLCAATVVGETYDTWSDGHAQATALHFAAASGNATAAMEILRCYAARRRTRAIPDPRRARDSGGRRPWQLAAAHYPAQRGLAFILHPDQSLGDIVGGDEALQDYCLGPPSLAALTAAALKQKLLADLDAQGADGMAMRLSTFPRVDGIGGSVASAGPGCSGRAGAPGGTPAACDSPPTCRGSLDYQTGLVAEPGLVPRTPSVAERGPALGPSSQLRPCDSGALRGNASGGEAHPFGIEDASNSTAGAVVSAGVGAGGQRASASFEATLRASSSTSGAAIASVVSIASSGSGRRRPDDAAGWLPGQQGEAEVRSRTCRGLGGSLERDGAGTLAEPSDRRCATVGGVAVPAAFHDGRPLSGGLRARNPFNGMSVLMSVGAGGSGLVSAGGEGADGAGATAAAAAHGASLSPVGEQVAPPACGHGLCTGCARELCRSMRNNQPLLCPFCRRPVAGFVRALRAH
ncbi:hypothetical protein GPECTOR_6g538 [Gonium pectorale]|uniref:Uncharacterized protein n=1 Tax=Gonium pectorale TaxID=33097 RepID=A0A150GUW3_GONPE|nr:hypothetical protein GPECTOR_6g538 [Gonium pectorale]|eukprot:KXZ53621.1 hypothetical protein GPECTOR_6g538 [Gonium pectorale]